MKTLNLKSVGRVGHLNGYRVLVAFTDTGIQEGIVVDNGSSRHNISIFLRSTNTTCLVERDQIVGVLGKLHIG